MPKLIVKDYPKHSMRVVWLQASADLSVGIRMYVSKYTGNTYIGLVVKTPDSTNYYDLSSKIFIDNLKYGDGTFGFDLVNWCGCVEFNTGHPSCLSVKKGPVYVFNTKVSAKDLLAEIERFGYPTPSAETAASTSAS